MEKSLWGVGLAEGNGDVEEGGVQQRGPGGAESRETFLISAALLDTIGS